MIDKYIHRASRKYLFVYFVDFKAAFDSLWRQALFYKLAHLNIGGDFLHIIQSMYSNVTYSIKIDGELSNPFNSNKGLKQGCVLSPMLFNLFLSDFPDIFDPSCHPVTLAGLNLNCLMLADDIVLVSESAEELQQYLNKLDVYIKQWKITVNTSKTKVIILNKGGHRITRHNFTLNDACLEIVQHNTYLGILFSSSGSFNQACKALYDKAIKSFFKLKQLNPRNNVVMTMKLFDMLVTPILTCGSNKWAPTLVKKSNTSFRNVCDSPAFDKLNIKLCKYILCTGKYSVNDAVRGELGRFPFMISILAHSFKYLTRLEDMPEGSLLKLSHLDVLQSPDLYNNSSWHNCLVELASRFHCSKLVPASPIRKLMEMQYKELRSQSIQGNSKLRSYV